MFPYHKNRVLTDSLDALMHALMEEGPNDLLTKVAYYGANGVIRLLLWIPVSILGLVTTLTLGLIAFIPVVGVFVLIGLSLGWMPVLVVLQGSSYLWLRLPLSRPFLLVPGALVANLGFIYVSLIPDMGEHDQKLLKLHICGSWPYTGPFTSRINKRSGSHMSLQDIVLAELVSDRLQGQSNVQGRNQAQPLAENALERAVLEALYNSMGGAKWRNKKNWMSSVPIGRWYGVTTDDGGHVTRLVLDSNRVTGTIPSEIDGLANLEVLFLKENQLTGNIPSELSNLINLKVLDLSFNKLTGSIPSELCQLSNLVLLRLGPNELSGEIPGTLGSLSNLQALALSGNRLTGNIPSDLGLLSNLKGLLLWDNQLSGGIPPELGHLTNLEVLFLAENKLRGNIPTELGRLANLKELYISQNDLTGCIPDGLRYVLREDLHKLGLPFCDDRRRQWYQAG